MYLAGITVGMSPGIDMNSSHECRRGIAETFGEIVSLVQQCIISSIRTSERLFWVSNEATGGNRRVNQG